MKNVLVALLLVSFVPKGQATGLSPEQESKACQIVALAKEFPNREGLNYKTLLVGIAIVESSLCQNLIGDLHLRKGKSPSLGCFQFQVATATWLIRRDPRLRHYKKLSKWRLSQRLVSDLRLQVELASRFVEYLLSKYSRSGLWRYNGSPNWERRLRASLPLAKKLIKKCEGRSPSPRR